MWVDRVKELTHELLSECGHPDIVGVEWWTDEVSGQRNVVVHCKGVSFYLWQVRSSPAGGDRFTEPEVIVTKTETERRR